MHMSALFDAKNIGFCDIYVSARTRRGQFFSILCGRLLWTGSKQLGKQKIPPDLWYLGYPRMIYRTQPKGHT